MLGCGVGGLRFGVEGCRIYGSWRVKMGFNLGFRVSSFWSLRV